MRRLRHEAGDELVDGMCGLYIRVQADFCVFGGNEGWVLDIEDMLERCAGTVIPGVTLIELLTTKLDKACQ